MTKISCTESKIESKIENIDIDKIKCQYSPTRIKLWASLMGTRDKDILNIENSPHVNFLLNLDKLNKNNTTTYKYYKMHKINGKDHFWILDKINKFIELFNNIKNNGFNGNIEILKKPIYKNDYNDGYEIWKGHHRLSCCHVLNIKKIECAFFDIEQKR